MREKNAFPENSPAIDHLQLLLQFLLIIEIPIDPPLLRDEKVRQAAFSSFNTIARTMSIHYMNILNYFDNRSTNASAESFNAKIKAFRAQFRGVRNVDFFLFRLTTIFA